MRFVTLKLAACGAVYMNRVSNESGKERLPAGGRVASRGDLHGRARVSIDQYNTITGWK